MNFKYLIIILAFSLFTLSLMAANFMENGVVSKMKVCFNSHCFDVEIARTQTEKRKGLMFQESLDKNQGMLFVYQKEEQRSFWMKNMKIPLDIIWLDENKKVVGVVKHAPPEKNGSYESFQSPPNVKYVLELNAGTAEKIGLKKGDKLDFETQ